MFSLLTNLLPVIQMFVTKNISQLNVHSSQVKNVQSLCEEQSEMPRIFLHFLNLNTTCHLVSVGQELGSVQMQAHCINHD